MRLTRVLLPTVAFLLSGGMFAQVFDIAELNTEEIAKLDRAKTVVLIPGGILEEHGPYLPTLTDGYWNAELTRELALAIAARPGWSVVVFPMVPLGNCGANEIGGKYAFPGTYSVRFATLRAVFMDLATELGEQGFRWIFVIHGHGAPNHNRALDQAGDYFRETYRGRMVHLAGLMPVIGAWDGEKSHAARQEDGLPIHAGMDETSMMLALRPDLVSPNYTSARPYAADKMEDLIQIARQRDWPGYFGSPRLATAAQYANGWQRASQQAIDIALRILDGSDERRIPGFGDEMKKSAPDVLLDRASLEHEQEVARKQQKWLKRKKLR